jgi:hypothetical protein
MPGSTESTGLDHCRIPHRQSKPHQTSSFQWSKPGPEKKSIHANALKDMASRKGNLAFSTRGNSDRRDGASDSRFDSQYSESSPRQLSPNRGTPRSTGSYDRDEAIPPLNGDYRSLPSNISPQNQASLLFNAPNPYTPSGGQRDRWSP